jgi:hypothetical protein
MTRIRRASEARMSISAKATEWLDAIFPKKAYLFRKKIDVIASSFVL